MAGVVSYSREQLIHLQSSPLVRKPDSLPSIEQWMDQQQKARPASGRENEQPSVPDATSRPSLIGTRHFSRGSSTAPEDIVLGPPKMAFASASRLQKLTDLEKRVSGSHDDDASAGTNLRGSMLKDRESERATDRVRERTGFMNGRKSQREEGEGWTSVKNRKSLGAEDTDRILRNGDRDKEKDNDHAETGIRRLGLGRGRDAPWGRDDNTPREGELGRFGVRGSGSGGWRDRERERERERERDRDRDRRDDRQWTRGGDRGEEVPEWADAPTPKEEKKGAHTMEDFQKWKEQMNARNKGGSGNSKEEEPAEEVSKKTAVQNAAALQSGNSKPATPLAIEPEKMFGMWGTADTKKPEATPSEALPPKAGARSKTSKFASFFSPAEEKKEEELPPVAAPPAFEPELLSEDKAGFQRILQMLGGTTIGAPLAPVQQSNDQPSNGTTQGIMLRGDMPPPQQPAPDMQEQDKPRTSMNRTREERDALLEAVLAPRTPMDSRQHQQSAFGAPPQQGFGPMSPTVEGGIGSGRSSRLDGGREDAINLPPSRNSNGIHQDTAGLNVLLESRNPHEQHTGLSKDREFLLNLMQQSRGTPTQLQNQSMQRPPPNNNMPMFPENRDLPQGLPKSMAPPPGLGLNPQMINEQQRLRHMEMQFHQHQQQQQQQQQHQHQHQQQHQQQQQSQGPPPHPELLRKNSQHHPNMGGFFDDPAIALMPRRNTNEQPPNPQRLQMASNLGIPSQPMPEPHWMKNPGMQSPQERIPPPPGFGNRMPPAPPGFGGGQMPFGAGNNGPMGPPGIPRGAMPGPGGPMPGAAGMFPGPGGHAGQMLPPPPMGPPQGHQQGFPFGVPGPNAPPGFGPPMGDMMGPGMNGPQRRGPPGFDMFPDMSRGRGGMPPGAFGM